MGRGVGVEGLAFAPLMGVGVPGGGAWGRGAGAGGSREGAAGARAGAVGSGEGAVGAGAGVVECVVTRYVDKCVSHAQQVQVCQSCVSHVSVMHASVSVMCQSCTPGASFPSWQVLAVSRTFRGPKSGETDNALRFLSRDSLTIR